MCLSQRDTQRSSFSYSRKAVLAQSAYKIRRNDSLGVVDATRMSLSSPQEGTALQLLS